MSDVECPYCDAEVRIDHDDGYGYEHDTNHEEYCSNCDKSFGYRTTHLFCYEAHKADCLNDGDHALRVINRGPYLHSKCEDCDFEMDAPKVAKCPQCSAETRWDGSEKQDCGSATCSNSFWVKDFKQLAMERKAIEKACESREAVSEPKPKKTMVGLVWIDKDGSIGLSSPEDGNYAKSIKSHKGETLVALYTGESWEDLKRQYEKGRNQSLLFWLNNRSKTRKIADAIRWWFANKWDAMRDILPKGKR